jgi:hypothetical protein
MEIRENRAELGPARRGIAHRRPRSQKLRSINSVRPPGAASR